MSTGTEDRDSLVAHILNSNSDDFLSLLGGGVDGSAAVDLVSDYFTADKNAVIESSDGKVVLCPLPTLCINFIHSIL